MIEIILFTLGFLGIIIATYSDLKTTEIPDFLSFSLIISGLALRTLDSLPDLTKMKIVLVNFGIFFIIANIMYYSKQWGGGDAKLLIALSVIFATYPKFLLEYFNPNLNLVSFPLIIFINILIVGAVYSLLYSFYLAIKHKKRFIKEFNKFLQHTKKPRYTFLALSLLIIIATLLIQFNLILIIFAISIIVLLYFWIFIKSVENVCMYKKIPVSQLREGDWIVNSIKYQNKYIYKKNYN